MNTYKAYYKNKEIEVNADTSYAAQQKAAAKFRAKKTYEVTVVLVAQHGFPVIHSTAGL